MFLLRRKYYHLICTGFMLLFITCRCHPQHSSLMLPGATRCVNSLLIDNGNLIAATAQGIFIYRNNGSLFEKAETNVKDQDVLFLVRQPGALYAASWDLVYRSEDGGATWKPLPIQTVPVESKDSGYKSPRGDLFLMSLSVDPTNPDRVFVGTSQGLFQSSDKGESWVLILGSQYCITTTVTNNSFLFSEVSGSLYRTSLLNTDSTEQVPHVRFGGTCVSLSVGSKPGMLYRNSYSDMFQSNDNGTTWTRIDSGQFTSHTLSSDGTLLLGTAEGYVISPKGVRESIEPILRYNAVSALTRDEKNLYAGMSTGEVYVSRDVGKSWNPITGDLADPNIFDLVLVNNTFYAASDSRGLFRSSDGKRWSSLNLSFPFEFPPKRGSGFIGSILVEGETIVAGTAYRGVYRSTDAGGTWLSMGEGLPQFDAYRVQGSPTASDGIFAMSMRSGFFRFSEGANRWEHYGPPLPDSSLSCFVIVGDPTTRRRLYLLGTMRNGIFALREGDERWLFSGKGLSKGSIIADIGVVQHNSKMSFIVATGDGIYRSTNLGEVWEKVYSHQPQTGDYTVTTFASNSSMIIAGTEGGNLVVSVDGGSTWRKAGTERAHHTQIWNMVIRNDTLWIATVGAGLHHLPLSQLKFSATAAVAKEEAKSVPREFVLNQNYPNPFNATTTFTFSVVETRNVSLRIYDIQGREIETIIDKELQPDNYSFPWNARSYASGTYFFRLIAGSFISTKKLVLLK